MNKKELETASKRSCFNLKDSGINFTLSLILPFLGSLLLILLFMFLAAFSGYNYSEFIRTEFVQVVNMLFTPIVFFLIYFIYCRKTKVNVFKASEINREISWLKVLAVVVMAVTAVLLISPMITLIDYGFSQIHYNPENNLPYKMDNALRLIIGIVAMAILPSICEELLFRGLIFKGLQEKFNSHIAILLSATMFTLLHGSLQQTVYQFIFGVLLGYAMHYGKNIIYPIILHFVNNLIVVINSFVYTLKGIDVNIDPVYNSVWDYVSPVLFFIVAAAFLVGLVFVLRYLDGRKNKEQFSVVADDDLEDAIIPDEESKETTQNVEKLEEEPSNNTSAKQKLTKEDNWFVYGSIGLGLFLWLSNTIMQFFGM